MLFSELQTYYHIKFFKLYLSTVFKNPRLHF